MIEGELDLALDALSRAGIVAAATETFFGLLGDARRGDCLDRIISLKGRDAMKGISLLLPSLEAWAELVVEVPPAAALLAAQFWPGPLTIALPARATLDTRLTLGGTVAVRWPGPSDAGRIAAAFGRPLTATSANLSGAPPSSTTDDVHKAFPLPLGAGDLTLVSGEAPGGRPSTIVTIQGDDVRLTRRGAIEDDRVASALAGSGFRLVS